MTGVKSLEAIAMTISIASSELRAEADRLREKARKLLEAAAILDEAHAPSSSNGNATATADVPTKKRIAKPLTRRSPNTRLYQLRRFLRERGPSRRSEIMSGTSIPKGTIGFLLTRKNGFEQDAQKRWYVAADKPPQ